LFGGSQGRMSQNKAKQPQSSKTQNKPSSPQVSKARAQGGNQGAKRDTPIPPRHFSRGQQNKGDLPLGGAGFERLDDSAERQDIEEFSAKIKKCSDTINLQSQQIKNVLAKKQKFGDEIGSSIKYIQQTLNPGFTSIKNKRDLIIDQQRTLTTSTKNLKATVIETQKSLPLRWNKNISVDDYVAQNYEKIEDAIKRLEYELRQITSGQEERRTVAEINSWKNKRILLENYRANVMELDNLSAQLSQANQQFDDLNETSQKLKQEKEALDQKITAAKEAQKNCETEFKRLCAENDATKLERDQLYKQLTAKRDALNTKWASWKDQRRIEKEQRDEKRQQQLAERQRKEQERLAKKRAEDVRRVPLKDEVEIVNELESYLNEIQDNKANQKQIVHDVDILFKFERLSLLPPSSFENVASSKVEVQNRKAEFLHLQREILAARKAKQPQAAGAEEKLEDPQPEPEATSTNDENNEDPQEEKSESAPADPAPADQETPLDE